jgi:hypothetical protein
LDILKAPRPAVFGARDSKKGANLNMFPVWSQDSCLQIHHPVAWRILE